MAALELTLNPRKNLKRADLVKAGEMFIKAAKDTNVDLLILKLTDDRKGGENSMAFPFRIVEK